MLFLLSCFEVDGKTDAIVISVLQLISQQPLSIKTGNGEKTPVLSLVSGFCCLRTIDYFSAEPWMYKEKAGSVESYESFSVGHEAKMTPLPSDKIPRSSASMGPIEQAH